MAFSASRPFIEEYRLYVVKCKERGQEPMDIETYYRLTLDGQGFIDFAGSNSIDPVNVRAGNPAGRGERPATH